MRAIRHFLQQKAFRIVKLSHKLPSGVHIEIRNPTEWRIYNDIFVDGDYDEPILQLISREQTKTLNVLDLGSNVGFFTLRLLHLVQIKSNKRQLSILGVEGSTLLCKESMRRIEASEFSKGQFQIRINRGLIGQREGEGILYHMNDHGLSSLFRKEGKPEVIPFLNISSLVNSWDRIGLLKCDIEGAEFTFLKNYPDVLMKTDAAVFEFHTEFCDYDECFEIITAAGFRYNKLLRKSPHLVIQFFWK